MVDDPDASCAYIVFLYQSGESPQEIYPLANTGRGEVLQNWAA
jgi:hypothetical protein